MRSFSMDRSLVVGKVGENVAADWLAGEGYFVESVADDIRFQPLGVDLLACNELGEVGVEVKTDRHTTGNVYIEEVSSLGTGSVGCILSSQADYLFYYFPKRGNAVVFPLPALQEWCARRLAEFRVRNPWTDGNATRSQGRVVPKATLLREVAGAFEVARLPRFLEV